MYLCSNETEDIYDNGDTSTTHTSNITSYIMVTETTYSCIATTTAVKMKPSVGANQQNVTSSIDGPLPSQSVRVESCNLQLMVAIIPSAILLVLLYVTIMGWIVFARLSKRKISR